MKRGQLRRSRLFIYESHDCDRLRGAVPAVRPGRQARGPVDAGHHRAIQRGELRATRLCLRLRIPRDAFDDWVARSAVRLERPIVEVRTVPAVHGSFRRLLSEDARRRR
jgi:hypothetical protein